MDIKSYVQFESCISIPKSEYEDLIRESNTVRIIENIVANRKENYIDTKLFKDILGLFMDEEESEDE